MQLGPSRFGAMASATRKDAVLAAPDHHFSLRRRMLRFHRIVRRRGPRLTVGGGATRGGVAPFFLSDLSSAFVGVADAMRGQGTTVAVGGARPALAAKGQHWPRFSGVMRFVRSCLVGDKYEVLADDLAKALGCSHRTARRIIAGQDVGTAATLAVLTHDDLGAPFLSEVLNRVPAERREALATALREAADLVRLEAEQERVAQEIAEKRAGR